MSGFAEAELKFLTTARLLARIATVGRDGTPHVTPVGWSFDQERQVIEIGGNNLAATKKFRDVLRSGRAAVVIDEVQEPWRPRGMEIRGRAEAISEPNALIRIHPERVVAWGFDGAGGARDFS